MTDCRNCKARPRADHVFVAQKGRDPKGLDEINAAIAAKELKCPKCGANGSDRGAAVQPDVPDHRRRRSTPATTVGAGLPAPRDGAGDLRQLRQRAGHHAPQAAVRRRPDRQGVPQRDHARQLHLPHARVRADGDRVLRQAGRGRGGAPGLDRRAHAVVRRPRHAAREPAPARAGPRSELAHYAKRCVDLEYRFPMGWSELEGIANRTDFDLKAHSRSPENPDAVGELQVLRSGTEEAHRPVRHRAVGGRRPGDAGVPVRRLRRVAGQGAAGRGDGQAARAGAELRQVGRQARREADGPRTSRQRLVAAAREDRRRAAGDAAASCWRCRTTPTPTASRCSRRCAASAEKMGEEYTRTVLRLHPRLAPITVAVFPLKKNEPRLVEMARGIKTRSAGGRPARRLRRHRRHRQALPPPGRDRHAVLHHRRLPEPGGRDRHGARPRHDGAGARRVGELGGALRAKVG